MKGDIEALVKNKMKKQKDLDYYLYRMLKHYEKDNQGEITVTNIHEFMEKSYTPLLDPFIPVYNIDKDSLSYEGTGFFSNGKLNGRQIRMKTNFFSFLDKLNFLRTWSSILWMSLWAKSVQRLKHK
jgi:spore germination protein